MSTTKKIAGTVAAAALGATALAGCGSSDDSASGSGPTGGSGSKTVTLVSHDSFNASKDVLKEFTAETGYTVKVLKSGDAGAALNQEILTKGSPRGDVFFGVDNTLLSRALDNGLFTPYEAKGLGQVAADVQLDAGKHRVTPVDTGDICINYDKKYFADKKLAPPKTFDDLAKPAYKDLLVTENAATSSPGLGFLLGTVATYGEDGYQDYWKKLKDNGVKVVDGWEQAYNEEFSGSMRRQEGQGGPAARRQLRLQPARRGAVRGPAAEDRPHRRRHRDVLPSDRVRRSARRSEERGGRQGPAGLPDRQEVPGGHASQHVRQPGEQGREGAGPLHEVRCHGRQADDRRPGRDRQEP